MGLKLYTSDKIAIEDLTGEVITSHSGTIGEAVDVLLYLRNDDESLYYDNIEVVSEDSDDVDDTIGVYGTGRGFKLVEGSRQPTELEWDNVLAGDFITMPSIGSTDSSDTTTYFPFWLRVITPGNLDVQTFDDVNIVITGSEHLTGT